MGASAKMDTIEPSRHENPPSAVCSVVSQDVIESSDSEFVRLLTKHQSPLRAYLLSLMPSYPDAEDLLQEVNILLWENRRAFQLGTNFKAWAYQVVRYRVINKRKKLQRESWLVFDDDLADTLAQDGEQFTSELFESKRDALRHCLRDLQPEDQRLIDAHYSSSGGLKRLASETGRSAGALRVALFRLRTGLRRCIDRRLAAEGEGGRA